MSYRILQNVNYAKNIIIYICLYLFVWERGREGWKDGRTGERERREAGDIGAAKVLIG